MLTLLLFIAVSHSTPGKLKSPMITISGRGLSKSRIVFLDCFIMLLNAEVDALGGLLQTAQELCRVILHLNDVQYIITKITSGSLIFTISTSHVELQYDNRILWLTDCFKYKHTPRPVHPILSHSTILKPSIIIFESRMLLFRKDSVRPTNYYLLSHQGI